MFRGNLLGDAACSLTWEVLVHELFKDPRGSDRRLCNTWPNPDAALAFERWRKPRVELNCQHDVSTPSTISMELILPQNLAPDLTSALALLLVLDFLQLREFCVCACLGILPECHFGTNLQRILRILSVRSTTPTSFDAFQMFG